MENDYLIELDEETMRAIEQLRKITLKSLVQDDGLPQWVADLLADKMDNKVIIKSAVISMLEFSKSYGITVKHGRL